MSEPKPNIAVLASYRVYPPKMGGQKCIALFCKYLSHLMPVSVISTKNNNPVAEDRITLIPALSNSKWRYIDPFLFFKLKKLVKKNGFTHIILEHPYYGWLGILLKRACKVKLIIQSHNIEAIRFKSLGKWWWGLLWHYEKFIHRRADHNFFIQGNDCDFAIRKFKLEPEKCSIITYGIELNNLPEVESLIAAKTAICEQYGITEKEKILLFNGSLDYKPNRDALDIILEKINPLLLGKSDLKYRIIICGSNLPATYNNLADYSQKNITYAGFVTDIAIMLKGSDIFINPVTDGGGIKTKLVEALGYGLFVISTQSGAIGIPASITGNKMKVIPDNDWEDFTEQVSHANTLNQLPQEFFTHFFWGNIAGKAAAVIHNL